MRSPTGKTKPRKTTVVLSVTLVLLVVFSLSFFVIQHAYEFYYETHVRYPIYGGMTAELKDSELYKDMRSGKSFCFLGDSVTDGNGNECRPWYQPLTPYIKGERSSLSWGGWMVQSLIDNVDKIPAADIYVIAIGVNDAALPWAGDAAGTSKEFAERIEKLAILLRSKSPNAKIYFIAPWIYFSEFSENTERGIQFREALEVWCGTNDCIYVDPVPVLSSLLGNENRGKYMIDGVHPNTPDGIGLYSYAVLKADHDRKQKTNFS